jgi:hypothetical protein
MSVNFDKKKKTPFLALTIVTLLLLATACKTEYYIIKKVNMSGGGNYTNSTGLDLIVNEFSINSMYRLPQGCSDTQAAFWNTTSSTWYCSNVTASSGGSVTSVAGGFGFNRTNITSSGTLVANLSELQARVLSSCAADSSIRVIAEDGSVTCETDSGITSESDPVATPKALEANLTANLANQTAYRANQTANSLLAENLTLWTTKLNVTDQRFNESGGVASLNNTKLNITDQRYNDTAYADSIPQVRVINLTTTTYNGSLVNGSNTGYKAASSICNLTFNSSHLCTQFEVTYFVQKNNINYLGSNDTWIIAGSPKYIPATSPVNDCNGFTYDSTVSYLGNYWHFNSTTGGEGRALNCATFLRLACCT